MMGETIFATMSRLATEHNAINLGQGFPDTPGPALAIEAGVRSLRAGHNQYAPAGGVPELRTRVASIWSQRLGRPIDPLRDVTITVGATEAIAAACLAWLEPGDEAIVLEPAYDAYLWAVRMAGATPVGVDLGSTMRLDAERLEQAITPRTRMLIVNSPHNPSGMVVSDEELAAISAVATRHDLRVLSDEVYEFLVYEGSHRSIATFDAMADRTVVVSSAAKTFGLTGWKVGWAIGPADLVSEVRSQAQYLTYAGATPLQHAVADALGNLDLIVPLVRDPLARQRDVLVDGLAKLGFTPLATQAGYFVLTDLGPVEAETATEAALILAERAGIVTIPIEPFYVEPERAPLVLRWSFARQATTLRDALAQLRRAADRGLLAPKTR
ncbi:aminotransferase class I and II [Acidimicrobium ferrooxidans DSM 10331]|uniref:Aminotransferase class I and II n=2 Tax=Acidimicrobium ferrooxidans TaxID=53635 RepID=C7M1U2_ACIFD|nr:aminotransferase class I and II [Acidimicrobium ferrooxidans DSM 10331]